MMLQFDERGFITHIRSDPESQEIIDNFLSKGDWLHIRGKKLPREPFFTPSGEPILNEKGKQIVGSKGFVYPDVTHDFHYVKNGKVVARPRLAAESAAIKADGKDTFTLKGLPRPCVMTIDGEPYEIKGGVLHFSTKDAGTYRFEAGFPFVDGSHFEVTAK
ncbi:hypothetical protein SAMN04515648_4565 [Phyllobacterium sp. CL33Tsu]|uniref:hypothetical protein n=1 Tax=Phyllobacterium sp. CL33Tsu TaxID=1798191 RepID=UPI0008EED819|nr:hypothetical protein [Phyllobacterium sp. CL33Tsu]SFJ55208.1 hypothetical protein SAMN04515648_4565 [Phyllobacterium sp. CL33Tsu]